ncbi:MAG: DUF1707 domain-containing protein, partial [Kribbellaceae bacterium]|nr:DUF1707 domain-containing protein [Kribbellaceae bacterium]
MSTIGVGTRPSDAERDRALAVLRDGAGSGRLSHDTFIRRMNVVLRARTTGELADVLRDLPTKESRLKAWTRTVRSKLPRLTFTHSPSNQAPATRSAPDGRATPGGLDAGGLPGGPD